MIASKFKTILADSSNYCISNNLALNINKYFISFSRTLFNISFVYKFGPNTQQVTCATDLGVIIYKHSFIPHINQIYSVPLNMLGFILTVTSISRIEIHYKPCIKAWFAEVWIIVALYVHLIMKTTKTDFKMSKINFSVLEF